MCPSIKCYGCMMQHPTKTQQQCPAIGPNQTQSALAMWQDSSPGFCHRQARLHMACFVLAVLAPTRCRATWHCIGCTVLHQIAAVRQLATDSVCWESSQSLWGTGAVGPHPTRGLYLASISTTGPVLRDHPTGCIAQQKAFGPCSTCTARLDEFGQRAASLRTKTEQAAKLSNCKKPGTTKCSITMRQSGLPSSGPSCTCCWPVLATHLFV